MLADALAAYLVSSEQPRSVRRTTTLQFFAPLTPRSPYLWLHNQASMLAGRAREAYLRLSGARDAAIFADDGSSGSSEYSVCSIAPPRTCHAEWKSQ